MSNVLRFPNVLGYLSNVKCLRISVYCKIQFALEKQRNKKCGMRYEILFVSDMFGVPSQPELSQDKALEGHARKRLRLSVKRKCLKIDICILIISEMSNVLRYLSNVRCVKIDICML